MVLGWFFCIQASSCESERVFSKAGQTISDRRTRLKPEVVDQLLFLNRNRHFKWSQINLILLFVLFLFFLHFLLFFFKHLCFTRCFFWKHRWTRTFEWNIDNIDVFKTSEPSMVRDHHRSNTRINFKRGKQQIFIFAK